MLNDSKFFVAPVQNEKKFFKLLGFSERTYGKQTLATRQCLFIFICFLGNSCVASRTNAHFDSHFYNSPVKKLQVYKKQLIPGAKESNKLCLD